MATELMEGGSLEMQIGRRHRFGEAVVRFWAAELACALQYLHTEHRMAHGNISTRNILVDGMGHVALTNVTLKSRMDEIRKADGMAAAEQYATGFAADWWGLGVVMYECLYGRQPFKNAARSESSCSSLAAAAATTTLAASRFMEDEVVFPVTTDSRISMDCISAIRGLLHKDPLQRLGCGRRGFDRLKRHPFFATFDWSLLEDRGLVPPFVPDDVYAQYDPMEFMELGECIDLQPPPLDPQVELVDLEVKFADFDYTEYQRFKGYIERHGCVDEQLADAIRHSGVYREPPELFSRIAAADMPLEFLALGGLPVV
ncbi:hypothetical protein LPJ61_005826, partial [Coemansia biformis]